MVQKKFLSLTSLSVIFLLLGCTKSSSGGGATSSFKYSGTPTYASALLPGIITFTNNSTNASGYFWNFGDGTNSTQANPKHYYYAGATYTVSLTAFGKGGGATTSTQTIKLYSQVAITSFSVNSIPLLQPNGTSWNFPSTGGPNVFVDVKDSFGNIYLYGSEIFNVTSSNLPLNWSINPDFFYYSPEALGKWSFVIYNNNSGIISRIDSIPFHWLNYVEPPTSLPSSISLDDSAKGVSATLNLQWQ